MRRTLILSLLFYIISANPLFSSADETIRVAILTGVKGCNLKIKGKYRISLPYTRELLKEGKNFKGEVKVVNGTLAIGKELFNVFGVDIYPKKDGRLYVNSRPYRGGIRIIKEGNKLLVINLISIEDYLKGVIQYEVAFWWPMEALKAQAVVARSYALYMKKVNKDRPYDLTSDVLSQIYGGKRGERWRIKRAVRATEGLVLFYKGEVLPAFYHACCGGHTDSASHLWKIDIPPLRGVPCNFCYRSPHYRWKERIKIEKIIEAFREAGYDWKRIDSIKVKERYDTGFVKSLEVVADGKVYVISGKDFRKILGCDLLRSRRFLLRVKKGYLCIRGFGWGHGVGLCQWGAYGMARRGFDFKQILSYYYPGAEIKKVVWDESQN